MGIYRHGACEGFLDKINKINGIQLSDSRQGEGKSSGQIKCFLTYS